MSRPLSALCILSLFVFLAAHSVSAAESPADDLVNQAESFRERPTKELLADSQDTPPEIDVSPEKALFPRLAAGPRFYIRRIEFRDNTILPVEEVKKVTARFEGRMGDFTRVRHIARVLTRRLRARGYLTSRAYVPPQNVTDGVVAIRALEGRIGDIEVKGARRVSASTVRERLRAGLGETFRYQDLENSLAAMNQWPDVRIKAYVMRGADPGTSDLLLEVRELRPYHASYEINNQGTKLTHKTRHLAQFTHTNLTGRFDSLQGAVSLAEEGAFRAGSGRYEFPLPDGLTSLELSGSYAQSALVKHLKSAEIEGESLTLVPGLRRTLFQKANWKTQFVALFEYKNSETLVNDVRVNYDRSRALVLGPAFEWRDSGSRTWLSAMVHRGIPGVFGGAEGLDPAATQPQSGSRFTYFTVSANRAQRLPGKRLLLLAGEAQWSEASLSSLESFRAGGFRSVRGYPESDALGDRGYRFSAEIQSPAGFIPEAWTVPFTRLRLRDTISLAAFVDGAKAFRRDRAAETSVKDRFLLGVGAGIRVRVAESAFFHLDWAAPLGDDSSDEDRPQAHFLMKVMY